MRLLWISEIIRKAVMLCCGTSRVSTSVTWCYLRNPNASNYTQTNFYDIYPSIHICTQTGFLLRWKIFLCLLNKTKSACTLKCHNNSIQAYVFWNIVFWYTNSLAKNLSAFITLIITRGMEHRVRTSSLRTRGLHVSPGPQGRLLFSHFSVPHSKCMKMIHANTLLSCNLHRNQCIFKMT